MDWKKTCISVISGVLLAGIIMLTLSFTVASVAS
jgi:hypothetical protein